MENTNNTTNTNEAVNTQAQEQNVQAPAENQQQAPEKKSGKVKGFLKKAGIVAGAVGVVALSAFGGFEVGKHSTSKASDQAPAEDTQAE